MHGFENIFYFDKWFCVDLANGLGRVESKRVRVKTGQLKKGLFGSGWNGFGSERVSGRVG
ncbi:hypothetical protein Hdeb2414_s0010g00334701 [Helianthus debilis subsp. tardiflorus]